jgi:DNA repair protein RadC
MFKPEKSSEKSFNIKSWSPEDRPREKLLLKGKSALSDAELLAILLGTGTPTLSAVDLGKKILLNVGNDLHQLARHTVKDLVKVKGIGEAKAVTIIAAMELGRRRKDLELGAKPRINGSQDAYQLIKADLQDIPHEEFWVILLNRANRVVRKYQISLGGVAGTVASIGEPYCQPGRYRSNEEAGGRRSVAGNTSNGSPYNCRPEIL